MTTKSDVPKTDEDKQWQPMPGEVALKDARRMALHFAVVEKLRMDAARRGSDAKAATAIGKTGAKAK